MLNALQMTYFDVFGMPKTEESCPCKNPSFSSTKFPTVVGKVRSLCKPF